MYRPASTVQTTHLHATGPDRPSPRTGTVIRYYVRARTGGPPATTRPS